MNSDVSTVSTVTDGLFLGGVLTDIRRWLDTYICVNDDADLDVLTLWAAHTHVVFETYTSPRLILDSTVPGSGKTTVLEHFQRLCHRPVQMGSVSSSALLARMLQNEIRTLMVDEVDRTLDPKKPGVEELIAILNSGYKRGATRPVLVPVKGGSWEAAEMPTYSPVVMAGNAPNLPDDTRSRSIRVLLMPDVHGIASDSDWEMIEPEALELGEVLASSMDRVRDSVRAATPEVPVGCVGRNKEKWRPLARIAAVAGGDWPATVNALIERDLAEQRAERDEGLTKLPPAVVLLHDLHAVWNAAEPFLPTSELISRLVKTNGDYWGRGSAFGRELTAQRLGRMLAQSAKAHSTKNAMDVRGWRREQLSTVWRSLGLEPSVTVETVETSADEVVF